MTPNFAFVNNTARVVLLMAKQPDIRMREIAQDVGLTERAVQRIIEELQRGGYVSITKSGRRNQYVLHRDQPLPSIAGLRLKVSDFIGFCLATPEEELSTFGAMN